jgi:hypothetical protein
MQHKVEKYRLCAASAAGKALIVTVSVEIAIFQGVKTITQMNLQIACAAEE